MKAINWILLLLFAATFSLGNVRAQKFDATSLGMGRAYGGVARGVESLTWNPANLALPRSSFFEMNFIGLNLNVSNSALTLENYRRYFTESGHGGDWDDQEKQQILDLVPEDGLNVNGEAGANALGVVFGRYGFGIQAIGNARGLVPRGPFEMILFGNVSDLYRFGDVDADEFTAVKFSLAASHPIPLKKFFKAFGVGLNLNYYRAINHAQIENAGGVMYTGPDIIYADMDIAARTAEGGSGFSMDIGAAGDIDDEWTFSVVFRNLFGGVTWDKNPKAYFYNFAVDSAKYRQSFTLDPGLTDTSYAIDPYKTSIPVVFHMGVAFRASKKVILDLDIEQAFRKGMGYSEDALLSIGTEYRPVEVVPLRAGFSFGGKWGFMMGLGMGFHFKALQINIGYASQKSLWPGSSKGYSTGFDIKIVI